MTAPRFVAVAIETDSEANEDIALQEHCTSEASAVASCRRFLEQGYPATAIYRRDGVITKDGFFKTPTKN